MRFLLVGVSLLVATVAASGQEAAVQRIWNRYETAKPTTKSLAFYSLDWAPDLTTAKARARQERRPIFLIGVTNITAGCNFYAGHT
jgi:hypothetical protein